jgi:aspartate/tyrosine/aromatic aminotransferase
MGFFDQITLAPPDAIFGLQRAFAEDPRPHKINLTVGLYRTEELKTPVLSSVKKAEEEIVRTEKTKEYLPLDGHQLYLDRLGAMTFGDGLWKEASGRIVKMQTVGGTNALRVGGEFLCFEKVGDTIHIPEPTWPNHKAIFMRSGLKIAGYPYYDAQNQGLFFEKLCEYLNRLSPQSIVLLHAVCHNPTGLDLNLDQWEELSKIFLAKRLIPFFDLAYQGFGEGLEEDAAAVKLFAKEGHEFLVAQSLSKNFSLYAERVGALFIVCGSHKSAQNVLSRVLTTTRPNYSNPPLHGAQIVATILNSPTLKKEWENELADMRKRVQTMRTKFVDALVSKAKGKDFAFLKNRVGLFSFSGLSPLQVERLIKEHGIYMTSDGRMNVAGITPNNLDFVVESINSVL